MLKIISVSNFSLSLSCTVFYIVLKLYFTRGLDYNDQSFPDLFVYF